MLLSQLSQFDTFSQLLLISGLGVLPFALLFFQRVVCSTYDSREPTVLWPKIPFIGHAISNIREGSGYYERLYKKARLPVYTLPGLTSKLYVLNSPALISGAMRCPTLSADWLVVMFTKNALAASRRDLERLKDREYIQAMRKVVYASLNGEALRPAIDVALREVAEDFNQLGLGGGVCEVPNVGDWLQDVLSRATNTAWYGSKNPITPELMRDVWKFDKSLTILVLGLAPTLLAPQAVAARARIQAALKEYYEAGYDQGPDVSAFVKDRAAAKRQLGANRSDLASGEAEIPWGPLANTVPSLLWFFLNVFARPGYAERVRQETAQATTIDGDSATIDVGKLGKQPFIGACLQEVQRLYNKQCSYRQVLEDTVLRDADGREYLLKKGALVQWFHGVNHLNEDVWGPDVGAFDADRFLSAEPDQEKKQREYMMPFGGGKHLCPGRRFAVTNIMCMVCALALVFDVEGVAVPPSKAGYRLCHMLVPAWETGRQPTARFRRRQGWEKMRVKFVA